MKTIEGKKQEIISKYMNMSFKHGNKARETSTIRLMNIHINLSRNWIVKADKVSSFSDSHILKLYSDEFN